MRALAQASRGPALRGRLLDPFTQMTAALHQRPGGTRVPESSLGWAIVVSRAHFVVKFGSANGVTEKNRIAALTMQVKSWVREQGLPTESPYQTANQQVTLAHAFDRLPLSLSFSKAEPCSSTVSISYFGTVQPHKHP